MVKKSTKHHTVVSCKVHTT